MRIRTQAAITYGVTLVAIGGLSVWGVSETPVSQVGNDTATVGEGLEGAWMWEDGTPTRVDDGAVLVQPVLQSHCVASVDEGLDWYQEGRDEALPTDETSILYDACVVLGDMSEAYIWEDGSWRVTATEGFDGPEGFVAEGVYWRGCFSVGTCMD